MMRDRPGGAGPSGRRFVPAGRAPLEQRDRLGGPARVLVGLGQVPARGLGIGMVGAQHSFPAGQGLLEQRDRLGGPARRQVRGGEVTSGGQGAGVVGAQQPLSFGQVQLV